MKKGVVMEVDDDFLTMLTVDGEFLRARNQKGKYQVGEEIDFFPVSFPVIEKKKLSFLKLGKIKLTYISSFAAILLFLSFIPMYVNNEVYAYMSIDINPSFEVGLDKDLTVVSLEAMNADGEKILSDFPDWKDKHIDFITETIINKSHTNGYLDEGKQVLITTVVNEHDEKVDAKLKKNIEKVTTTFEKEQIEITSVESTVETRKEAKEKGVTTGKLLQIENKLPSKKEKNNSKNKKTDHSSNNNSSLEQNGSAPEEKPDNQGKGNGNENQSNGRQDIEREKREKMSNERENPGQTKKHNSDDKERGKGNSNQNGQNGNKNNQKDKPNKKYRK